MIRIQFAECSEQLQRAILKVQNEFSARGMGRSGAVVKEVHDLCARDVEIRVLIIWQNIQRVLSTAGVKVSDTLAEDLKTEVLKYQQAVQAEPGEYLQTVIRNVGIGSGFADSLTESWTRAVAKVSFEIELFALSLERQVKVKVGNDNSSQTHVYVTAPVGIIQTGPNATASIVQSLTLQDREVLANALDLVIDSITALDRLPVHPKEDVVELVVEAKRELEKTKPNNTRLNAIFTTVATAIQTVGSVQPAYYALKTALLPLGIVLP